MIGARAGRGHRDADAANTSFGPLKQIDAGVSERRLRRSRSGRRSRVILLHGWPYDIHSYVDVAPLLASAGYRVIVPYLRGYGTTRFLSSETFRNGQQSAVAVDIIALMDALKIEKAIIAGCDWGARTANIIAALWPERCKAMVSVSGYLIGSQEAGKMPLPPKAELEWWYQYLFRHGARPRRLREIPARVCKAHLADRFAEVGIRRCHVRSQRGVLRQSGPRRHRDPQLSLAARPRPKGEPKYDDLEQAACRGPVITVPTITLEGDANGAPHPDPPCLCRRSSPAGYAHRARQGRHRSQSTPGGSAGLYPSGRRRRPLLISFRSGPASWLSESASPPARGTRPRSRDRAR